MKIAFGNIDLTILTDLILWEPTYQSGIVYVWLHPFYGLQRAKCEKIEAREVKYKQQLQLRAMQKKPGQNNIPFLSITNIDHSIRKALTRLTS